MTISRATFPRHIVTQILAYYVHRAQMRQGVKVLSKFPC
jgi:hypothetical protein